jgi:thiol-disulfide isomerase/thioredoxin
MALRLLVVAGLLALIVGGRLAYRRWRRHIESDTGPVPRLPARLLDGAERTWVVFTTPYCGSCRPLTDRLRADDPAARVVTVDATREPALAGDFRIRSAPTVLLAGADGNVHGRFVGAGAVEAYLKAGSSAS